MYVFVSQYLFIYNAYTFSFVSDGFVIKSFVELSEQINLHLKANEFIWRFDLFYFPWKWCRERQFFGAFCWFRLLAKMEMAKITTDTRILNIYRVYCRRMPVGTAYNRFNKMPWLQATPANITRRIQYQGSHNHKRNRSTLLNQLECHRKHRQRSIHQIMKMVGNEQCRTIADRSRCNRQNHEHRCRPQSQLAP